jgi:hypothetical protein
MITIKIYGIPSWKLLDPTYGCLKTTISSGLTTISIAVFKVY